MARAPADSHLTPQATQPGGHVPVMLAEVLDALQPADGGIYLDATFGLGGYAKGILDSAACTVWGLDRDPQAIARGQAMTEAEDGRLHLAEGRFGALDRVLEERGVAPVDGIAFDLGVSSPQLDVAERGFSFRFDGPLDMRMGSDGPTAADVVNELAEGDLARIVRDYGEEKKARRVARAITQARGDKPIQRTGELAEIVRGAVGHARGKAKAHEIDPATRTFQAIRIYVNDELGELERGLAAAERALKPGGRLAVVSFHSLEDRAVKQFLRTRSGDVPRASRHSPDPDPADRLPEPTFRVLFRQAKKPRADEAETNPRARSARLRAAERTAAPAWANFEEGRA
ncbi:16S rRNA (cytosine(1402)-N(4))-methyltransferase [Rhodovibrio salinarum]|uniref:Ribosomal RNA small subunit methyltransferase H n=2 Tax=Rhodovibrio salinarum TaxID=1087 RepID=A0A934UYY3_9PROT|nr:16S rRNA (cytosine(1402)-N(4))-methyltransferase [Rhodovibrio salinarum]